MMKRAVQRTYGSRQSERAREKLGQEKKERTRAAAAAYVRIDPFHCCLVSQRKY